MEFALLDMFMMEMTENVTEFDFSWVLMKIDKWSWFV